MKSLTIYQKTKCPLDSFHCSQQKYFKIQKKTLKNIGIKHHSQTNFSDLVDRSQQKIKFKDFIDSPTMIKRTQKEKIVDETISNNFQKITKIQTIIPKIPKFPVENKIRNKITEIDDSYSQKKIKRLIKRPSLEKQFQGPSFWSYDPKHEYIKRKVAKQLTFSKSLVYNEKNSKKTQISEPMKKSTIFKSFEKSQTNSTQNSFCQKEKPKLKRRAPFTYFSNKQNKENMQNERNSTNIERKRNTELMFRTKIMRTPSSAESTASNYERYRHQTAIQTPFIPGEIDRQYQSQKKKYNIQQSCQGFLKNVSIVDFIEAIFHEQQLQSADDSFYKDQE